MHVGERKLTLEEYRNSEFESYEGSCFSGTLDDDLLTAKGIAHVIVLDLAGALTSSEGQEFLARIERFVEQGEHTIVVNLKKALKYVDSAGLGALVRSIVTLKKIGGTLLLVNPPRCFRDLVTTMRLI